MNFHELDLSKKKARTRAGRGISAGRGKTAGRGTKGQSARSGGKVKPGFEGGQNPLTQRIPKLKGFKSFKKPTAEIKTSQLQKAGTTVTNQTLADAGLIKDAFTKVKIILDEEVKGKYNVTVQAVSQGAKTAIEKAGGTVKTVALPQREKVSKK